MPKQPKPEPDVKVHHRAGCGVCGRTDKHTHTQAEHRERLDSQSGR